MTYSNSKKRQLKKDDKIPTKFEAVKDEHVINKEHLDTKLAEVKDYISYIEKKHKAFKDLGRYNEKVLIGKAVETTI